MAGPKKKQHYIPQIYLNEFADAQHQLYVFDKFDRRSYKTHGGICKSQQSVGGIYTATLSKQLARKKTPELVIGP